VEKTDLDSFLPSPREYAMNLEAAPDKDEFINANKETRPATRLYIP
jgi:hypothetical protein